MNRKNLETVLEQYMNRLADLEHADDSDQVYKWRAVGCFKRFWNLEAADFAGMFEKAMREAENLLDDAAMQPVAGLRMLLGREQEVEYVRECFRFLFSDDGGDLKKRQDRADFFADKINERVRYYERGTKKYLQNRDHVIYYLNLWKPEENYVFESSSASGWAACVEYDGEFGSKNFSLESYYNMCDELVEEIRENEELTARYSELFEEELDGYDDQLHILAYDIMDCASLYRYYAGLDIRKVPSRERTKTAEAKAMQEKIKQEIEAKEKRLKELQEKPVNLPDVVGKQVRHKTYGIGTVQSNDNGTLLVHFEKADKKFKYPSVFTQGFLSFAGEELQTGEMAEFAADQKKKAALEKEIGQLKKSLGNMTV